MSVEKSKNIQSTKNRKVLLIFFILVLILIIAMAAGYYFYDQKTRIAKDEVRYYTEKLAKVIKLPEGEVTLATVSNADLLTGQVFFKEAQNGDKVLIFPDSQRAILYRPSTSMIIHVGPVEYAISPTQTPEVEEDIEVGIYNGTVKSGLARTVQEEIEDILSQDTVYNLKNTSSSDYENNLVIIKEDRYRVIAEKIAERIGGEISGVPEDESIGDEDIVIILGESST